MEVVAKHEASAMMNLRHGNEPKDATRGEMLKVMTRQYSRGDLMKDVTHVLPEAATASVVTAERPNTAPDLETFEPLVPPISSVSMSTKMPDIERPTTSPELFSASVISSSVTSLFSGSRKKAREVKTIYGTQDLWVDSEDMMVKHNGVKAFSEDSVLAAVRDRLIDTDALMRLRLIKQDSVKVKAYDRSVEKMMLKNCSKSTNVKINSDHTVKAPEVMFGAQKVHLLMLPCLYKHSYCGHTYKNN
jgi:hypothetical protein